MPSQALKARVSEAYGKLPLSFEANQGQSDPQVKFLSRGKGYTLSLTSTEAVLTLTKPQGRPGAINHRPTKKRERGAKTQTTVLRTKLVGANPASWVVGVEELPGKGHYFIGNDSAKWRTNVPTYAKVEYQNVYPGGNLIYYGNEQQLECVVTPGADPEFIKLALEA